jgi:hypothetical protein
MWLEHDEFMEVVRECWITTSVEGWVGIVKRKIESPER